MNTVIPVYAVLAGGGLSKSMFIDTRVLCVELFVAMKIRSASGETAVGP